MSRDIDMDQAKSQAQGDLVLEKPVPYFPAEDFTSLKKISDGSFGAVLQAYHANLGAVCIKKMDFSPRKLDESKTEVIKLFRAQSKHISKILGMYQEDNPCGIILHYYHHGSVERLLEKKDVGIELKLRIIEETAQAMQYLHSIDILHRKLMANNVLLDDELHCQVSDFGLTYLTEKSLLSGSSGAHSAVSNEHIAPEHYKQTPYTNKADIYSYGIFTWQVITGERPFAGMTQYSIGSSVKSGGRPDLRKVGENATDQMKATCKSILIPLIERCWHQEPYRRPEFTECVEEIQPLVDQMSTRASEEAAEIIQDYQSEKQEKQLLSAMQETTSGNVDWKKARGIEEIIIVDKPGQCGPLTVSEVTFTSCLLTWTPPADNGGCPLTYKIEMKPKRGDWKMQEAEHQATELKVHGLLAGQSYVFRVSTMNSMGTGEAVEMDRPVLICGTGEKVFFFEGNKNAVQDIGITFNGQFATTITDYERFSHHLTNQIIKIGDIPRESIVGLTIHEGTIKIRFINKDTNAFCYEVLKNYGFTDLSGHELITIDVSISNTLLDGPCIKFNPGASQLPMSRICWIKFGLLLMDLVTDHLRVYLNVKVNQIYARLKASDQIDTQTYNAHIKEYPAAKYKLQYKSINRGITTGPTTYSYRVQSHVDFSKLFLQPHMAQFTAFDSSFDSSAALNLLCNIEDFHCANEAKELREFRNEFAHCDWTKWNEEKLNDGKQKMETVVKVIFREPMKTVILQQIERKMDELAFLNGELACTDILQTLKQEVKRLKTDMSDIGEDVKEGLNQIIGDLHGMSDEIKDHIEEVKSKTDEVQHHLEVNKLAIAKVHAAVEDTKARLEETNAKAKKKKVPTATLR